MLDIQIRGSNGRQATESKGSAATATQSVIEKRERRGVEASKRDRSDKKSNIISRILHCTLVHLMTRNKNKQISRQSSSQRAS